MISLSNRSPFRLGMLLLSLGLVSSCKATMTDPREDLVSSLKGANVEGFNFVMSEDEGQVTASLTNKAVQGLVRLDSGSPNLVLRYTSVKDKTTNSKKTYKAEIVKTDGPPALLITDIASGEVLSRKAFPPPERDDNNQIGCPPPFFGSLEDCIADFNCRRKPALQAEANRTCENQFAGLTCSISKDQCFSVHMVIVPNSFRCRLRDLIPDLDGFVVNR
jgi:hypothetical protein